MTWTVKSIIDGGYLVTDESGRLLSVPNDPANRHYRMVQDWIAEGNTPLPADPQPPTPLPPSAAETLDAETASRPGFAALVRWLAKREGLTTAQIRAALITEMEAQP